MQQIKILFWLAISISFLALGGCATPGKNTLPQGGEMTMADIYKKETGLPMGNSEGNVISLNKARTTVPTNHSGITDYVGYTATSKNEINNLFRQMKNPQIPMYVYPHIVDEGDEVEPVPGYSTAFYLYRETPFAMPSEETVHYKV
jgi:conjugative transfer region lipoprotein (TIGR03751 family)